MTRAEHAFAQAARTFVRGARMLDRVDSGLTLPQYRLLTLLDAKDERSTALAQRLTVSKPAISSVVDVLTALRYVQRRSDDDDRRACWLRITHDGRVALRQADAAYARRLEAVAGRMDDPALFLNTIADFAAALDSDLGSSRSLDTAATSAPSWPGSEVVPE
jgi:DNA-binding MarR family transcriptional regulator